MTRFRVVLIAVGVTLAPPAFAQQTVPQQPPPPPAAPAVNTTRPDGSTIRCKDGSWAPAGATVAACDAHQGLAYRFPVTPPPPAAKPRPDADAPKLTPPPVPQGITAPLENSSSVKSAATGSGVAKGPPTPPDGATLLCMDGTYLTGPAEPGRCSAYGGLTAILPIKRP